MLLMPAQGPAACQHARPPSARACCGRGCDYALSKPTIYWPWLMAGFIAVFAMSLPVLLAAFADHVYDAGAGGYGLLNALVALGALAGAIASARRRAAAAALGGPGRRDVRPDAVPGCAGAVHGVVRRGHGAVRILVPDVPDRRQPAGPDQRQHGDPRPGHEPVHHGADRRPGHRRPDDRLDCRAPGPAHRPPGVRRGAGARGGDGRRRAGPARAAAAQSGPKDRRRLLRIVRAVGRAEHAEAAAGHPQAPGSAAVRGYEATGAGAG